MITTAWKYFKNASGTTLEKVSSLCPPDVVAACHNAKDSITISGPKASVEQTVQIMKKQKIFAKTVDSSGVPFHSPIMKKALPFYLKGLEHVRLDDIKHILTIDNESVLLYIN